MRGHRDNLVITSMAFDTKTSLNKRKVEDRTVQMGPRNEGGGKSVL